MSVIASFPPDFEALDREYNEKCRRIQVIKRDVLELEEEVVGCNETRNSDEHLRLREQLSLSVKKLYDIPDKNLEEIKEMKKRAIEFAQNVLEKLEIRISNNEQLENFHSNRKKISIVVTSDNSDDELSSIENETDSNFKRKIETNVKFHSRKVQGYKDISKYFQPKEKENNGSSETDKENAGHVDSTAEIKEASEPNHLNLSPKDIVKKLDQNTSPEEKFKQVTVKQGNIDISKYFQPQPKKPKQSPENAPKSFQKTDRMETVEENKFKTLTQTNKDISKYFQISSAKPNEIQIEERKDNQSADSVFSSFSSSFDEIADNVENELKIDESDNDSVEVFTPRLSVRERIKRMNERKLDEKNKESVKVDAKNEEISEAVGNVQMKNLKRLFEGPSVI